MTHANDTPVQLDLENGIAWVTFNRPDQLNSIDVATADAFLAACRTLETDASIRTVVLCGAGKGFGAGGDLPSFTDNAPSMATRIIEPMNAGIRILSEMDAPVIASLHGVVAGGSLSLACACDLAIAADNTRFNMAYIKVAATCDLSGSWHLPRIVGLRNAMAMALLGDSFDADQALRLGLVNRVVPVDQLRQETLTLATRLASGPTQALGRNKRLLRSSLEHDLSSHLDLECQTFQASAATQDFAEGVDAFLNKRAPHFQGK